MIIKDFIKTGIIPDIYKAIFRNKNMAVYEKIMPGIVSPAAFASKPARAYSKFYPEDIRDISKFINKPKVIPKNVRSINQASYKCIEHLQGSNPKEYAIMLDEVSGQVLQEGIGAKAEVSLNFTTAHTALDLSKARLSLLHGHTPIKTPSGEMTLPVSLQDFIVLNNTKLQKITAFNSKGMASTLEKTENYVTLKPEAIDNLKRLYLKELLDQSPRDKTDYIRELLRQSKENQANSALKREITNRLNDLQYQEGADLIIDGFWKKHANKYGLNYASWL